MINIMSLTNNFNKEIDNLRTTDLFHTDFASINIYNFVK